MGCMATFGSGYARGASGDIILINIGEYFNHFEILEHDLNIFIEWDADTRAFLAEIVPVDLLPVSA